MKNLLFLFLLIAFSTSAQTKYIPAGDNAFRYVGRFDQSNPAEVRFDWSGVYIQFNFKGKDLAVKMNDTGHNYYNVFVDDQPSKTFDVKSDTTLVIARGLKRAVHKIQIYKRTEGNQGTGTFKGILISEKDYMLAWKEIPTHKIEFIGNSITCGYGTEGKTKNERFVPATENNYQSYAPIMARAFNADYHIVAHSGMGVVRNYGYKEKVSPEAMPARFNRVFDEKEQPKWDFSQWKPDVVVINLGTNDFSTKPYPDKDVFKAGYTKLINEVFKQYGNVPVFCVVGPMINEPCYSYVKEMVEDFRAANTKNVYFVGIPTYLMDPDKDLGSDSHPNYSGQRKMAGHVLPVISSITGWDYSDKELK